MKKINLTYNPVTGEYHVQSTTNTIRYNPGDVLRKEIVEALCRSKAYTINVAKPK